MDRNVRKNRGESTLEVAEPVGIAATFGNKGRLSRALLRNELPTQILRCNAKFEFAGSNEPELPMAENSIPDNNPPSRDDEQLDLEMRAMAELLLDIYEYRIQAEKSPRKTAMKERSISKPRNNIE
jgi:hypothetical protein